MKKLLMLVLIAGTLSLCLNIAKEIIRTYRALSVPVNAAMRVSDIEEDKEYYVAPIGHMTGSADNMSMTEDIVRPCGKYFSTAQYKNKTYVGFRFWQPGDTKNTPRYFPRSKFTVVVEKYDYTTPTVEFSNDKIVVHFNERDLLAATCFKDYTVI